MPKLILLLALSLCLGMFATVSIAQDDKDQKQDSKPTTQQEQKEKEKEKELTLERLFPEKGLFGPSARRTAFSHDGKYAAYLYRPYLERRHGSDLWIYDVETGEAKRITKVSVLSKFQEATRKVSEDRTKKAKKKGKDKDTEEDSKELLDDKVSGEWEGTLKGNEESDVPPDGIAFTLTLQIKDDGSVSGTIVTPLSTATITEGNFNKETGELTCTLTDPETGLVASLSAILKDGSLTGSMSLEELNLTLIVIGKRTKSALDLEKEQLDDEDSENKDEVKKTEEQDEKDKNKLGDVVSKKDADDKKSPRYGGVSSFTWAPESNQLIFTSAGDLYQFVIEDESITRLTKTRDSERDVQYLPDGSGYSYIRGSALIRVSYGSHLLHQLDPKLPSGETMNGYRISPDGSRLVFIAGKGERYSSKGRRINIINYRDRFAQVKQVTRHMPDDPFPDYFNSIYLYELDSDFTEEGELKKVYTHKQTGPRDIMRVPEWSPDSSRVAFAVFSQTTEQVQILEARFVVKEEKKEDKEDDKKENDEESDSEDVEKELEIKYEIKDAKIIYRFLHNGGPNTPRMIHPQYLPDSRRLTFITELSGFRHLHLLDPVYEQLDQLTQGRYEIYPFGISKDHALIFATSTKGDPTQENIYTINVEDGQMTMLNKREGFYNSPAISNDGKHALANHVDFGSLRELVAINVDIDEPKVLTDSHPKEAHELTGPSPEYFTYENRHGHVIHGHMFKPDDWTAEDKRPLLIYVYGGPLGSRKMVTRGSFSGSSYFFAYYMAKKHGFVTCTIDPRGASGYGGLFEKSNFEQVGKPQVEDLVDGAKWFVENQGVDEKRIGLHGWSFGGFQTQMCLYTEPDVFACGMAGAGPTEWANYNSWYTTGTIGEKDHLGGKSTKNERYSLLPLAKNLKARLLLMHGMEDSNVLYQDTVRVYRELLKAGKETLVELFLDPTGGHGMGGDVKPINRYRKYEEFLTRCLGEGEPAKPDAEEATPTDNDTTPTDSNP